MLELVQGSKYPEGTITVMRLQPGHVMLEQEDYWGLMASSVEKSHAPVKGILRV